MHHKEERTVHALALLREGQRERQRRVHRRRRDEGRGGDVVAERDEDLVGVLPKTGTTVIIR